MSDRFGVGHPAFCGACSLALLSLPVGVGSLRAQAFGVCTLHYSYVDQYALQESLQLQGIEITMV